MIAVYLDHGRVSVRKVLKPRRPEGFAVIRLLMGGICNTDLELQRGYYGFEGIPGHEFVGEVTEADDAALIGKRVVGEINLACENCDWCARGLGRHWHVELGCRSGQLLQVRASTFPSFEAAEIEASAIGRW